MRTAIRVAMTAAFATVLSATAALAQTELTYSSWIPWTHPVNTNIYIPWMKHIEEDSGGRIKFKQLPKAVAAPNAHFDAIRTGQADVGFSVHGYGRKQFAPYLFAELPFLGEKAVNTSIALQRTHEKFLADKGFYKGVHLIGMNTHGPGEVHHHSKQLLKPEDFEGQKMRTGGPIPDAIATAWGAVPINQPSSKSYEILSTGIADGIMFPFESVTSFNLTDLVPYSTTVPGGWYSSSHYLIMNQRVYDSLAPEDKAVVDKWSGEAFAKLAGEGWDRINEKGLEDVLANGNSVVGGSPELVEALEKLNEGFLQDYYKAAEEAGVDGKEMYDYFKGEVAKLEASN